MLLSSSDALQARWQRAKTVANKDHYQIRLFLLYEAISISSYYDDRDSVDHFKSGCR
ncbi:hypothetical protein NT6N_22560 [Oceaniferula spumae]|uniref:Uncharacterized protein n=1 Tax=Oceaniferula spumae TaxID=2979115 RepID=A0AAT9FMS4_9BACT